VTDPGLRARTYVNETHEETVRTVLDCADAVADEWDDEWTTDRSEVVGPLRAELEAAGAWARLPDVLAGAAHAAGSSMAAEPVANPPYVTATSRGPMLRATVSAGRLVVLLGAFEIEWNPTCYVRGATTPEEAVRARLK
jgi:hypothetical protein